MGHPHALDLRKVVRFLRTRPGIIWRDLRAQDSVEYALMAGFVTLAAGAFMPSVSNSISTIFSKIGSILNLVP